jgi:hypothetical protein
VAWTTIVPLKSRRHERSNHDHPHACCSIVAATGCGPAFALTKSAGVNRDMPVAALEKGSNRRIPTTSLIAPPSQRDPALHRHAARASDLVRDVCFTTSDRDGRFS